ncbi:hypothetical protein [Paludisphaera soli]|uniref:hypothetical protein n=1 Tax=Paludisphaera soli TaxID=2712865 RepID=UPI0013EB3007|nr:hypothetical protein [Paludisphaera soli]
MCRYGFHQYRDHFACFSCRKAFKQDQWEAPEGETWLRGSRRIPVSRRAPCPDCTRPMVDMGLDFKAPPRADRKAWSILESLARAGVTFHNCGCGGPGFRPPGRRREVPRWLAARRELPPGEALARRFAARQR